MNPNPEAGRCGKWQMTARCTVPARAERAEQSVPGFTCHHSSPIDRDGAARHPYPISEFGFKRTAPSVEAGERIKCGTPRKTE